MKKLKATNGRVVVQDASVLDVGALVVDPENRRERTRRGREMTAESFRRVGAGRSIVIDEDNRIMAGHGATLAASDAGITKVRVVDADGTELIAVRRRGLTAAQKRELAIYDNRTAELAEWNVEQLAADIAEGLDLESFWTSEEAEAFQTDGGSSTKGSKLDQALQLRPAREYLVVMCAEGDAGAAEWEALRERFKLGLVRRGGYKRGSPFDAVGVQRVVLAADVLKEG